ncbi:MAG: DUF6261 family protein [Tannerellaceae bacterium]|nr:DUF6261 family protein [Tannerellaceae bacterium]
MDNYRGVYLAPMNEASALYTSLVQDFLKEEYAGMRALVALAESAAVRLEQDNEAFKTLYFGRALGKEEAKVEGTMREARTATDRAFAAWAEAVGTFHRIHGMQASKDPELIETLSDIIMAVNAYLHQHETTYARRNPKYRGGTGEAEVRNGDGLHATLPAVRYLCGAGGE